MRIFDTNVQEIKYKTLKEVIRSAYEGNLQSAALDIPKKLAPGPKPELRCCIYKERAILGMVFTIDCIANIMHISGNFCKFNLMF